MYVKDMLWSLPNDCRGRRNVASPEVRFPADIATHSTEQTLYIDRQGLLRRLDYNVEIDGTARAAHYVYDHKEFSGIVFPTKRRVFRRQPDGRPAPEPLIISIDLDRIVLS
jgi:hypothetical protein